MRKFDYSFIKKDIPGNIIGLTNVITDLRSKEGFRKLQYAETFESLRNKAVIESVKGSNAIEGIVTTDSRIRDIVVGASPITHDEFEISGYADALNLIHNNYTSLDLDEQTIKMFHKMIEGQTNKETAGEYKNHDNYIVEYGEDGLRQVRFKAADAKETDAAMEQCLLAFYEARQDSEIPSLLLIPCFILDFLCIHPFTDGNGRVSRLITVLLLYSFGYDIVRYISLEGQINKYKDSYYEVLRQSSEFWHEGKNDYLPYITNFLQIIYKCFKELDESFMEVSLKKAKKSERVEAVLMNAVVPISKQEIASKLTDVSIKTIELVMGRLMKEGKIVKIGTFKDARYMKK